MNKPTQSFDQVTAQLCAEVDYWKARAEKAEHALQFDREQSIKSAGLWDSYTGVLSLLGGRPAKDLQPSA